MKNPRKDSSWGNLSASGGYRMLTEEVTDSPGRIIRDALREKTCVT